LPLRVPPCFSFVRTDAESSFYFLSQFTMKTTHNSLEDYLKTIVEKQSGSIAQFIAKIALEIEPPKSFFQDLVSHGCISGMIGELVYYQDTRKFFDNFYEEIETLRENYEITIPQDTDLKNYLVWTAVEIIGAQMYQDWENGS